MASKLKHSFEGTKKHCITGGSVRLCGAFFWNFGSFFFILFSFIIKHIQQHDTLNEVFYFILFKKSDLNSLHF